MSKRFICAHCHERQETEGTPLMHIENGQPKEIGSAHKCELCFKWTTINSPDEKQKETNEWVDGYF